MNNNLIHNRHSFYKHTSATIAKTILVSRKLRWSNPSLFNDPFDVPRDICDRVDEDQLSDALVDRLNKLVLKQDLPNPEHHSQATRKLLHAFSKADEAQKQQLIGGFEESRRDPKITSGALKEIRKQWRSMYDDQRILCFTKRWDSASMWDRYSDGHSGALLEFACVDHLDSAWLVAKPVNYTDEPLHFNTTEGFADMMFYDPDYAASKIMEEYTHTKTADWAYEKEWRIASWKRPNEICNYSDYKFHGDELHGITFGALMSDDNKTELTLLVKDQYPHVKLWQAIIEGGRRQLWREFTGCLWQNTSTFRTPDRSSLLGVLTLNLVA